MSDKAREIIITLYNISKEMEESQLDYSEDTKEKIQQIEAVKELQDLGYLIIKGQTIGYVIMSITYAGEIAAKAL